VAAKRVTIGLVGCGNISGTYLEAARKFEILEVAACADRVAERAAACARQFNVPKACTLKELLEDRRIDIVLNLTNPGAHHEVAIAALRAGKSVYNEKPLAVKREEGKEILETARAGGLRVGCAPDTFLGGGLQTCRKLIDDGWIGDPVAATAFMMNHGHESWHPDPEFFYQAGGGPMFDMGPYYLTAMVVLLGPVRRVTGSARISFPERIITSEPKCNTRIRVEVPTHVVGVLEFVNGAIGLIITSFDVWGANLPFIEVHGSLGSLSLPDPNGFAGPARIKQAGAGAWKEVPLTHGYVDENRSIGVADMAYGLRSGRPHRANGELAYHVLDIMHAIHEASARGRHIRVASTCARPPALPVGLPEGVLDD